MRHADFEFSRALRRLHLCTKSKQTSKNRKKQKQNVEIIYQNDNNFQMKVNFDNTEIAKCFVNSLDLSDFNSKKCQLKQVPNRQKFRLDHI